MSDLNMRRSRVNTDDLLSWSASVLVGMIWLSCLFFALVIINIYIAELFGGDLTNWNQALPDLYNENSILSTVGMGTHFIMGTLLLILGGVQLIKRIRVTYPAVHRILGRIYVAASFLTAIGGLTFIFITGTAGGVVMDIGFGIYGILMLVASVETIRHARGGRMEKHNNWALRLYALAIGSWLYRVMYATWSLVANDVGVVGAAGNFTGLLITSWISVFTSPASLLLK